VSITEKVCASVTAYMALNQYYLDSAQRSEINALEKLLKRLFGGFGISHQAIAWVT